VKEKRKYSCGNGCTNLGVFSRDPVENGPVCALRVTGLFPRLRVVLVALGKTLRAEVVGIAERLVYALKRFVSCHEDLEACKHLIARRRQCDGGHTRSKAVEQARGWVATKMGFCDMLSTVYE